MAVKKATTPAKKTTTTTKRTPTKKPVPRKTNLAKMDAAVKQLNLSPTDIAQLGERAKEAVDAFREGGWKGLAGWLKTNVNPPPEEEEEEPTKPELADILKGVYNQITGKKG